MKTIQNTLALDSSDVAEFRLHVLTHYYKYGLASALDAFKVKQSTLYDWKKLYERSGKRVSSLVPCSTRPHELRYMQTDFRLVEFIREMRREHGNIGQNIIKPFLDEYARSLGIASVGLTTIAKIIKKKNFTFEKGVRAKRKTKYSKLRIRKSPKVTSPGLIQMDSIVVYINKERHLFMSLIDIYTKFAFVKKVDTLSTKQALKVFREFEKINLTQIQTVQTDNGSEFLFVFHEYLERKGLKHQFIYPKSPRINGVIERFNRTVQEEFILRNDEIYYDTKAFEQKLVEYLYWYNNKRPHSSLNYLSPMAFIQTNLPK
jgi:putative transposase